MKKNRIRICGRNTSTLPTPAITPSTSRLRSGPSGQMRCRASSPSRPMPALMHSIGASPRRTPPGTSGTAAPPAASRPHTGCIATASMRCWKRCVRGGMRNGQRQDAAHLALQLGRCRAGRAPAPRPASGRRAMRVAAGAAGAHAPSWRTATVSTTGTAEFARQALHVDVQMPARAPRRPCSAPPSSDGPARAAPARGAGSCAGWWHRPRTTSSRRGSRPRAALDHFAGDLLRRASAGCRL